MRPCKICGLGIEYGWIHDLSTNRFYHADCFQHRHQDEGLIVAPETAPERVAKKIEAHGKAGTLDQYPIEERLRDLNE